MSTENKYGGWVQAYMGGRIFPLDPDESDIHIPDIAHSLSMQCRYNGHCKKFYSVAEHCVLLSYAVDPEFALDALMHDASEAYLCDIPRPIKPHLGDYYKHEDYLMTKIALKFKFNWPPPPQVKEYDTRILNDERANMANSLYKWDDYGDPLNIILGLWSPDHAEYMFIERYLELTS